MAQVAIPAELPAELAKKVGRSTPWLATISAFLGWVMVATDSGMQGFALPFMMQEANLPLDTLGYWFAGIFAIGLVIALVTGPMVDRWGRRAVFQWSIIISSCFSVLSAAIVNPITFLIFRSGVTAGTIVEQPVGATMVAEQVPEKHRGLAVSFVQSGYVIGFALASLIAMVLLPVIGWRWMFVLGIFPAVVVIIIRQFVPESPRFVVMDAIRKARQRGDTAQVAALEKIYATDADEAVKGTYGQLWHPSLRRTTIFVCLTFLFFAWANGTLSWYGVLYLTMGKGLDVTQSASLLLIANLVGFIGYNVSGYISDYLGRRETVSLFLFLNCLSILGMIYVANGYNGILLFQCGATVFGFATTAQIFSLSTEAFPTRCRGTANNLLSAMIYLGIMSVSLLVPIIASSPAMGATEVARWANAILINGAVISFVACLIVWGVRRIAPQQKLEQIAI